MLNDNRKLLVVNWIARYYDVLGPDDLLEGPQNQGLVIRIVLNDEHRLADHFPSRLLIAKVK